jgi:hypothetical protein
VYWAKAMWHMTVVPATQKAGEEDGLSPEDQGHFQTLSQKQKSWQFVGLAKWKVHATACPFHWLPFQYQDKIPIGMIWGLCNINVPQIRKKKPNLRNSQYANSDVSHVLGYKANSNVKDLKSNEVCSLVIKELSKKSTETFLEHLLTCGTKQCYF